MAITGVAFFRETLNRMEIFGLMLAGAAIVILTRFA